MKSIEITVYKIDELKDINIKAYNKVMDDSRQFLIDSNFNYATEDVIYTLKEKYNLSIDEKNIFYSISYCQGDGFCFIDSNILSYTNIKNKSKDCNAFEKWIIDNLSDDDMRLLLDYLNCNYNLSIIKTSHHYSHVYTCIIDYEVFYSSDDENYIETMNNFIYELTKKLFNNVYVAICNDIETMLYSYYDIAEDDVIQFINDNDYYYDIDGVLY